MSKPKSEVTAAWKSCILLIQETLWFLEINKFFLRIHVVGEKILERLRGKTALWTLITFLQFMNLETFGWSASKCMFEIIWRILTDPLAWSASWGGGMSLVFACGWLWWEVLWCYLWWRTSACGRYLIECDGRINQMRIKPPFWTLGMFETVFLWLKSIGHLAFYEQ